MVDTHAHLLWGIDDGPSTLDASIEMLGATAYAVMQRGDRFVIETPGGGGFGGKDE